MRFVTRHIAHLLLATLLAFTGNAAWAQKAGQILFTRGIVTIVDAQDSARGARSGTELREGDRVVTGSNGIVQMTLTDGTLIGLRGDSEYLIKRQRYEPEAEAQAEQDDDSYMEQAGELFSGWMRVVTGAIGKANPNRVSQSTSVATIGIRGTVFQVIHVPEEGLPGYGDTSPGTYLLLEEGEVSVFGGEGTRVIRPGEIVFVPFGGGAPTPAPEKRGLFERKQLAERYSRIQEFRERLLQMSERQEDLNDTNADELGPQLPPLLKPKVIGFTSGLVFSGRYQADVDPATPVGQQDFGGISGIGFDALGYFPTRIDFNIEGPESIIARPGEAPVSRGSRYFSDGTQIHWGIWKPGSYVTFGGGSASAPTSPWHFMMATNVVPLNNLPTAGSATYTYTGGTALTNSGSGALGFITGGDVTVNFASRGMAFNLNTDNFGTFTSTGGVTGENIEDLYQGAFFMGNGIGTATMTLKGSFVGTAGQGIVTAVELNDQALGIYEGTAAFKR